MLRGAISDGFQESYAIAHSVAGMHAAPFCPIIGQKGRESAKDSRVSADKEIGGNYRSMLSPISSAASSNILGTQATSSSSTQAAQTTSSSSVFSHAQDIVTLSAAGQAASAAGQTGYASPSTAEAHSSRAGAATK
jgi:hypothetical protein